MSPGSKTHRYVRLPPWVLIFAGLLLILLSSSCNALFPVSTPAQIGLGSTLADTATPVPTPTPSRLLTPTLTATQAPGLTPSPSHSPMLNSVSLTLWAQWELELEQDVHTAAWSPDSQRVVFSYSELYGPDDWTYMYDVNTLQKIWQVHDATSFFTFSPDGKTLVSTDSSIRFWDAASGKVIDTPYEGNASLIHTFLPDGSTLLIGRSWIFSEEDTKTEIGVWDNAQKRLNIIIKHEGDLTALVVSPDGKQLAAALALVLGTESGRRVFLWDLATRTILCDLSGIDVLFSPAGNLLATSDEEGKIILIDRDTCQPTKTITKTTHISSFAFSPDGKMLAIAGGPGGTIWLRDVANGQLLYQQEGLREFIHLLTFSPDGQFLLSLSYGKSSDPEQGDKQAVQVWKVMGSGN